MLMKHEYSFTTFTEVSRPGSVFHFLFQFKKIFFSNWLDSLSSFPRRDRFTRCPSVTSGQSKAIVKTLTLDRGTHHLLLQTDPLWSPTSQAGKGHVSAGPQDFVTGRCSDFSNGLCRTQTPSPLAPACSPPTPCFTHGAG